MGYRASGVGIGSGARLATVLVGETWNEVTEAVAKSASAAEEELDVPAFSFALPPMAVGALWVVLLCETYQPRPIAPAMICDLE